MLQKKEQNKNKKLNKNRQTNKQTKTSKKWKETEVCYLPNKDLKVMIVKILTQLEKK